MLDVSGTSDHVVSTKVIESLLQFAVVEWIYMLYYEFMRISRKR